MLPYPATALEIFRTPGCVLPCFLGIRPGVTSFEDAIRLLRIDPRVDPSSIQSMDTPVWATQRTVTWAWNRATIAALVRFDAHWQAHTSAYITGRNQVERIDVNVYLPLSDVLGTEGSPRKAFSVPPTSGSELGWFYPTENAAYAITFACARASRPLNEHVFALRLASIDNAPPGIQFDAWSGFRMWPRRFCTKAKIP